MEEAPRSRGVSRGVGASQHSPASIWKNWSNPNHLLVIQRKERNASVLLARGYLSSVWAIHMRPIPPIRLGEVATRGCAGGTPAHPLLSSHEASTSYGAWPWIYPSAGPCFRFVVVYE